MNQTGAHKIRNDYGMFKKQTAYIFLLININYNFVILYFKLKINFNLE